MYPYIFKNIKPLLSSFVLPFIAISLSSCSENTSKREVEQVQQTTTITYPTEKIQLINPVFQISLPGELEPYEKVEIYAKVAGFVDQILVQTGDYVKKGQLLAVLKAPEMQHQVLADQSKVEKAFSDYTYAKQAYERLQEASLTSGAVASIELDRAKGAVDSSLATYNALKATATQSNELREYLRITAPFDGVITSREVSVGALTNASGNTALFKMAQDDKLRLVVYLPQKYSSALKIGAKVSFTVSSVPNKVFEAIVSRTSGVLNQKDRSLYVEIDIDNVNNVLHGGDYAQVKLDLQRDNPTYWVATPSILHTQMGSFVYVINEDQIKKVSVELGQTMDATTEVFAEFDPLDKVIIKPTEQIKPGKISL
ncbi:efflux RND transporter periplasmic adaptor subunit [Myroides sp. LJL116]